MNKEIQHKISQCKALQGKSIMDIIATTQFLDNLAAYITEQRELRKTARASYSALHKLGGARGMKLESHPIDHTIGWSTDEFALEFARVIAKTSVRPAAVREYVRQLGQQAYNLTIAQIVVEEFPELESVLIPQSNNAN